MNFLIAMTLLILSPKDSLKTGLFIMRKVGNSLLYTKNHRRYETEESPINNEKIS